jgi:hypothetical protein
MEGAHRTEGPCGGGGAQTTHLALWAEANAELVEGVYGSPSTYTAENLAHLRKLLVLTVLMQVQSHLHGLTVSEDTLDAWTREAASAVRAYLPDHGACTHSPWHVRDWVMIQRGTDCTCAPTRYRHAGGRALKARAFRRGGA